MKLDNKHIGKYKYAIYATMTLIGVSIPMTLGAIGEEVDKLEEHRNTAIKVLAVQAQEVCEWEAKYRSAKNTTLTTPDDIIKNAGEWKEIEGNCLNYVVKSLTDSFTKSENLKKLTK